MSQAPENDTVTAGTTRDASADGTSMNTETSVITSAQSSEAGKNGGDLVSTDGTGTAPASVDVERKEEDMPSYYTHSKKRYAVMFGYSGIGYKGLQINIGEKTIEGTLEAAICASGVVREENAGDLKKSSWSRTARTDKGVHAVGQVISLKMSLKDEPEHIQEFIKTVNDKLPETIRVFHVLRTTKSFNCKLQCEGRKYEYLVPVFLFRPRPFKTDKETFKDEADTEVETMNRVEKEKLFFKKFLEESVASYPAMEPEKLEHFRAVLANFIGTRNFHNFSPKMAYNNEASKRVIRSITVDGPLEIKGGLSVIRVNIEGQSFMLHQIRKMIGTALEITRRNLDPDTLLKFFEKPKMPTPMIPGEGLALRACLFGPYNRRYGQDFSGKQPTDNNPRYESIDFEEDAIKERADKFRMEVLYPTMIEQELESSVWSRYIYNQDNSVFPPVPGEDAIEGPDAVEKRKREKEALARSRRRENGENFVPTKKKSRTQNNRKAQDDKEPYSVTREVHDFLFSS